MSISVCDAGLVRSTLTKTGVVVAIVIGGWLALGTALRAELRSARAEVSAGQEELARFEAIRGSLNVDPEAEITRLEAQLDQLRGMSERAGDASRLYETIGTLARTCGVRVERIEPRSSGGAAPAVGGVRVESVGYSFEIAGDFAGVRRFVSRLEREVGICKIGAIRVRPLQGDADRQDTVSAIVETTHFRVIEPTPAQEAAR